MKPTTSSIRDCRDSRMVHDESPTELGAVLKGRKPCGVGIEHWYCFVNVA